MLTDEEAQSHLPRLLGGGSGDGGICGTNVRVLVTAYDVPCLCVRLRREGRYVPKRLNETCSGLISRALLGSALSGGTHAYMPIQIRAVPQEEYDAWLNEMAEQYAAAAAPAQATQLADARSVQ